MANETRHFYEFGPYRVDPEERQLFRENEPIPLPPKAFETLLILVSRSERVVLKDDLMKSVWPDTFVEEANLSQNIFVLRKALGETAQDAHYIATVPGRGYRFAQKVKLVSNADDEVVVESQSIQRVMIEEMEPHRGMLSGLRQHPKYWLLGAVAVLGVLAVGTLGVTRLRRPPAMNEADLVLVSDFVNTTGEPIFDGALKQALSVKLAESPYFNLVPESGIRQTLKLMARPPDEHVVPPLAREVCERAGAKILVTGSIIRPGNGYSLDLDAINCQTGASLVRESIEADAQDKVLPQLGIVIPRLRRKLGESVGSIQKFDTPIEQATTKSLPALKAFATGEEQRLHGKDLESVPSYKIAIDLDPDFAMAYARLGTIYTNAQQPELANQYQQQAYERRGHVTEKEKFYIVSHVATAPEKAIENYKLWTQVYPNDWTPFNNLANKYDIIGRLDDSVDAAQHALRLNPNHSFPYEGLARAYHRSSRYAEAKAICEKAIAKKLAGWNTHEILWKIAFLNGDGPGMQREEDWQKGNANESTMLFYEGDTFESFGQVRKAREMVEQGRAVALKQGLQEHAAIISTSYALDEAEVGNASEVREWVASALKAAPNSPDVQVGAALALARLGDIARAEELSKPAAKADAGVDTLVSVACIQAAVNLQKRNPQAAVANLEDVAPYDLGITLAGVVMYSRGLAYLQLKSGKEAAMQFQKIVDNRGAAWFYWPLAHLGLARAYALTGDTEKSLAMYRQFFELWKDADPDIRVLKEAKAEYAKLSRSGSLKT